MIWSTIIYWDIEQNILKLVVLGHFLPIYPPKNPKNQNFEIWKNLLEISSFYTCVPKIAIILCTVPEYGVRQTEFLSFWAIFCPFTISRAPNYPENQNFEKKEWKKCLEILSFYTYMCTIIEDHMIYGSRNIRCDRQKFLSSWAIFYSFNFLTTRKIKILKLKKTSGDIIILHICTTNENHMMYGSWDMECDRHKFLSFWTVFCPFTPLWTQKIKILKKWKKHLKILSFYKCVT